MKKHASLKILTGTVIGVTLLILFNHKTAGPVDEKANDPNNLNEAIASQFNDNIRDVAARLQEAEKKLSLLEEQNNTLKTRLPITNNANPFAEELRTLKEEVTQLKSAGENKAYPIERISTDSSQKGNSIKDIDQLLIQRETNPRELAYWQNLNETSASRSEKGSTLSQAKKRIPYYTIPAGSDLGHTTLLSALIGEVPVEGKLMQPLFPFSAIISRGDLMAANSIPLPPAISGMKINGYAIGVGSFLDNISCVRAYVTSALFVFSDGHFVTVGKEQMQGSAEMINNESLGYLTTAFGNPCIKGQYLSNAPRVLAAMVAAEGVKGFGNALSQWQMSYTTNGNSIMSTPNGSMVNYGLGGSLSQSTIKAADWLEKRIQGSFDMVFIPASIPSSFGFKPQQFSFHLTKTIQLDKDIHGRRLDYGQAPQISHDFSL
ncbi:TIGR03752 family integrating conjugative element protein [Legionella maceachernii]|uniref:Membrane protein n=1 Tax=Legionella maceachernii TaxID=466 RepID=A0A0W0VV38_9GAMM|nr:TIGR03752 family integrating conjugative element protein [Legionella maceachernii]KTD23928.1 membrane protein [Legionella maceachernii]SKA18307.1 integrating conjugative element protein, PFL_4705 family [Legionella maceachernii]SUP04521.1 integrating conjugative element protein, PFL_4705 family [Legionella maceachernii]